MANYRTFPWRDCLGKGWHKLVEEMIEDITKLGWDGEVHQVKEKLGGLRFYIGSASKEVHDRIHKAENISYEICEDCGDKGDPHGPGWIRTLCEKHHLERNTVCDRCKKNPTQEEHICPFMQDVNDDSETLCSCCEECTQNCADDI